MTALRNSLSPRTQNFKLGTFPILRSHVTKNDKYSSLYIQVIYWFFFHLFKIDGWVTDKGAKFICGPNATPNNPEKSKAFHMFTGDDMRGGEGCSLARACLEASSLCSSSTRFCSCAFSTNSS